jgi:hypothetical protein
MEVGMRVARFSGGVAVVVIALSAAPSAWAAFNDTRGEQWRSQCTAGQSKYTCCKNAELDCIDDCGALQSCKSGCSSSYSACVKGLVVGPQGVTPDLSGGAVLDPGTSTPPTRMPVFRPGGAIQKFQQQ